MKTLQKTLLALAAGSLMTMGAQAAVNYGNGMTAQPYIGAKIGQYDLDKADNEAMSYGIYGGAKFTPNFGVEAEYMTTNDEDFTRGANKSEYSADVYGLYGTYDYTFPGSQMYAKGRLGVAKNKVDIDSKSLAYNRYDGKKSDTGIAGGLGLGYNLAPNAAVEVAYDWYPKVDNVADKGNLDASGVTLGANFKF
ncbi:porin family protein [Psychrobacter sp. YP14]|uniref:Outer membrane beta-barrel protein n=3 Tax=Psychrobacter TaxID=497 RepID=A0A844M1Y5_9GAMM|nr:MULTISPECIES: porin family protein [Psychrobacter]AWT50064.1 porin family protein [Psychrobacter sp. YP14]MUG32527.1 outer membrane beta-barrel protein [Psychrobacter sanguinis]UNK05379.1 porin family protein [Psychrobacter sp. PraFG1]